MINKKILLSLLTIGLLACVASAGTWAYFKDSVTSTGNVIGTAYLQSQYSLNGGSSWTPFSGESATFGPFSVFNIVPDSTEYTLQSIGIKNTGNTSASVDAVVTPGGTYDSVPNLVIKVGSHTIYQDGSFGTLSFNLGTVDPNGANPVDASIKYTYTSSGNQNQYENKTIPFDLSISETAIHTP